MFTIRVERTDETGRVRHELFSASRVTGEAADNGARITLTLHDEPNPNPQKVALEGMAVAYVMNDLANTVWTVKTATSAQRAADARQGYGRRHGR